MTVNNSLVEINRNFQNITKKPERLLTVQDQLAEDTKNLLKSLYHVLKEKEKHQNSDALPELIIKEFDEEQIWQEIDLQNEAISNSIVTDVAHLLAKKERLVFELHSDENEEKSGSEVDDGSDEDSEQSANSDESDEQDSNEEYDEDGSGEDEFVKKDKYNFTSEIDDEFFKLSEMEEFCEEAEKEEETGKGGLGVDLFAAGSDEDEDGERELVRYNDFFGDPKHKKKGRVRQNFDEELEDDIDELNTQSSEKRVHFSEEAPSDPEVPDYGDNDSKTFDGPRSAFQLRQDRLKSKIQALEDEAMQEKPWHLQGEAAASVRPQNSLLEEFLEFDLAARPAPVFTEKATLRLEDIIRQRVKDKSWDDVVRKVKPVEDIREYRKQLVLNQEKSKISLAEVYEQEYLKQRDAAAAQPGDEKPETEPAEHAEIKTMMKSLFSKLDALSNFHYTPKPVAPEVKIISNLPAITMEDVAPVAMSDATLLAPEEVKDKKKGELMGKNDRTTTDKKRERRKKKLLQRKKQQDKLKKEKIVDKMSLGLGNKYSKEKAKRTLDELTKDKNIDKMVETQSKHVRSSTAFFNKLEDEVKGQIKRKALGQDTKRKKSVGNFSAKRIKL